jgi:hypothetical protein
MRIVPKPNRWVIAGWDLTTNTWTVSLCLVAALACSAKTPIDAADARLASGACSTPPLLIPNDRHRRSNFEKEMSHEPATQE